MILSLVAIAIIGGVGYFWLTKGFFSALIHMVCTLIAGAVAFAFWEPLAQLVLEQTGSGKGIMAFVRDSAWGVSLAVPFAVSLILLRVIADMALPKNVTVESAVDMGGGAVCGLVSGVIASGVFIISASYLRTPANLLGYQPVQVDGPGHLVSKQSLIVPVDKLVSGLYRGLSETSMSVEHSFAENYPRFALTAGSQRMSFDSDNKNPHRTTLAPGDVRITSRYTIEDQGGVAQTMGDRWRESVIAPQTLDGEPYPAGTRLEGFTLEFSAGSLESFGQLVIGHGQLWVTVENPDTGDRDVAYPFAAISESREKGVYGRYVFDGNVHISSVGGGTSIPMTFEFPVKPGFEIRSLTVRNLRLNPDDVQARELASISQRDQQIDNGAIVGRSATQRLEELQDLDRDDAATITAAPTNNSSSQSPEGVKVGNSFPTRITLVKGRTGGIEIDGDRKITGGQSKFNADEVTDRVTPELRVSNFATTSDTNLIWIDVAGDPAINKQSLLGRSVQTAQRVVPPAVLDTDGVRYEAVGFLYVDPDIVELRYTPGQPLRGLTETPNLSSSRDDQNLWLVFRVTAGAEVDKFVIGQKLIAEYAPPVEIRKGRR